MPNHENTRSQALLSYVRPLLTRDFLRYLGPGFIITVGFIDPGNWATNISGGSTFAYQLLWVIGLSTLMLILFQNMSARIGIVTGHSLAYNVRRRFARPWVGLFGVTIVLACVATDVAELLGGALGFQLLFGLPLPVGAGIAALLKVGLVITGRYHHIERLIVVFLAVIAACYLAELVIVRPDWAAAARGAVVPHLDGASILIAMGMLGAVVMPHNLYLHSNVILSREWPGDDAGRRRLMAFEFGDTTLAMGLGWLVNGAMIVVAAAVFARHGIEVTSIEQASATLEPLAGNVARFLFGVALLLAGLGSSITSSMAEANVLTGFLGRPEDPRSRFYRVALFVLSIPALAVILAQFDSFRVLILSQVVLSVQLPLTILPLLLVAGDARIMGSFASSHVERILGVAAGAFVVVLNALLLYRIAGGSF
ncbi:MAG: Nramp family divalent metal transporter [Thermoleophilia bacterium]